MSSSLARIAPDIIDATVDGSWGTIPRVPWVHVTSEWHEEADASHVSVRVRVGRHTATCRLWHGKTADREGGEVTARTSIPCSQLMAEPEVQRRLIQLHASQAIRFASGLLRESDPRIGTIVKEGELASFPRGLLFDPPRMRPPAWERPPMDSVPCSFCNSGFGAGAPAMWSGGNLLWTHPSCWIRTYDGD